MKMTKKLLAIALVLSMVLSFVACETSEANVSANDNELLLQNVVSNVTDETVGGKTEDVEETPASPEISTDTTVETTPEDTTVEVSDKDENETVIDLSEKEETPTGQSVVVIPPYVPQGGTETKPETNVTPVIPNGEYNEGVVLVKVKESFNKEDLGTLEYTSAEPLYKGSKWYTIELSDASKTEEAVSYLSGLGCFENVDYDYIMATTGPKEDAKDNPKYDDQVNLGLSNIPNGWTHNGKAPGGSPDVVVAVIDTGVDYNHLDLRNNIWINTAEIADNGKDDDGNGYIDDVYGWDCVGNDNDPMDDNGHGTHVAGIIAAENNKEGGIGVAYNCKVMVLKAGNSSGYFNNSDIAEAIQYAYMNGASVINMSFGGSNISIAVEDALENAYNSCILVAAAGNDSACNNLACPTCDIRAVMYPAALPYVIGVMSTDKDGKHASSFSNYDHYPYDSIEYEVYAVGEGVGSTWPSNKYACLNGTSMAAPTVSGIAALLRSYYTDREMYSTKFIQSQIVNTGTICLDGAHTVADVQEALNKIPKPEVNLYDYRIDDSTAISNKNNGNGVIDAGETVRLYVDLHNRGGVATDVNVSIDTYRSTVGDETLTDPYFTFVNNTMELSDIGTYSVRESGDKYFEIVVSPDCPNDYLAELNIRFTYKNGMDKNDDKEYNGEGTAEFNVSSGYHLPSTITEDTVYKADKLYIVGEDVIIPEGVTVTFEEGCEIQFYDDREYYQSPIIKVYGTLNFNGTKEQRINLMLCERHSAFGIGIANYGKVNIQYVCAWNLLVANGSTTATINISDSSLRQSTSGGTIYIYDTGIARDYLRPDYLLNINRKMGEYSIQNSYVENISGYNNPYDYVDLFDGCVIVIAKGYVTSFSKAINYVNNFIYTVSSPGKQSTTIFANEYSNNYTVSLGDVVKSLVSFNFDKKSEVFGNAFSDVYKKYASQIILNYYNSTGNPTVDVYTELADPSLLWPYVVSVEMLDKDGNPITTVGKEEITVRVTFNRDMDVSKNTYLTFGTIEPYADYRIDGEWISSTVWEGTYTLKAQIENGQNFLKVNNACAAEDPTKTVFGEYQLHEFTIDTTAAMAMNLMAFPQYEGIELRFEQDDYDTLLGYNIYRSEDKDGNFVKLNPTILLPDENTFFDDNAEPGKTYWYTYTVVLTDFSESAPAGKVQATALDTMSPSLYHTPVNQGYENNNLVISATATDNVSIDKVTLYYRTVGETEWKSLVMSKQNDKFSATIFGSDVTLAGIEYYIIATDGLNTVQKGSAEVPYTVLVKSADSLLGKGDVDGNGSVTTKDALMLMQCLNGDLLLTDDAFKRADLNGDTLLSSAEALRILQYVNGKVPNLDM